MTHLDDLPALLSLMDDIAEEDALDFADTPLDELEAKRLVALAMLKSQQDLHELPISTAELELSLLATAGHLVLENLLLNVRLLKAGGDATGSAQALMDKLKRS